MGCGEKHGKLLVGEEGFLDLIKINKTMLVNPEYFRERSIKNGNKNGRNIST